MEKKKKGMGPRDEKRPRGKRNDEGREGAQMRGRKRSDLRDEGSKRPEERRCTKRKKEE